MQNDTRIAVDVAKAVFELAVSDRPGHVARRERLPRAQFLAFFAQQPAATVVMEACGSAHYWARRIEELGHRVVLLPPHHVRPYVRRQQDRPHRRQGHPGGQPQRGHPAGAGQDRGPAGPHLAAPAALGLDGGAHRPPQRPARPAARAGRLHPGGRARGGARGVGAHRGCRLRTCPTPCGPSSPRPARRSATSRRGSSRSSGSSRPSPSSCRPSRTCCTIPGIGLLTATALVAFIGDIHRFPSGRHLASYLGLTPREYSSGLKRHLGRISKRGDGYLRTLLIHGARSVLLHARKQAARSAPGVGAQAREDPRPQQGRRRGRQQARPHRLGRLEHDSTPYGTIAKAACRTPATRRSEQEFPPRSCRAQSRVTAKQVGPAQGQPITTVALEAVVIDWLPARGFRHGPELPGAPTKRPEIRLQSAPFRSRDYRTPSSRSRQGGLGIIT